MSITARVTLPVVGTEGSNIGDFGNGAGAFDYTTYAEYLAHEQEQDRCADIARRVDAGLNADGDLNVSPEDIAWFRAHVTSEQMIPSCLL